MIAFISDKRNQGDKTDPPMIKSADEYGQGTSIDKREPAGSFGKQTNISNQISEAKNFDPSKGYGERLYKVILLGQASTGKTSLLIRFVDDTYNADTIMNTVGVDLKGCTLQIDNSIVRLQIWDT